MLILFRIAWWTSAGKEMTSWLSACGVLLYVDRVKRIWYLSPMRAAKVQASLRIRAVSPEPSLLAHTSSESRGTFRQKARSLAPLNGWACAVKMCHDGMLEDTNSLDGAHVVLIYCIPFSYGVLGKEVEFDCIDSWSLPFHLLFTGLSKRLILCTVSILSLVL